MNEPATIEFYCSDCGTRTLIRERGGPVAGACVPRCNPDRVSITGMPPLGTLRDYINKYGEWGT